jgi:hypothetical protein
VRGSARLIGRALLFIEQRDAHGEAMTDTDRTDMDGIDLKAAAARVEMLTRAVRFTTYASRMEAQGYFPEFSLDEIGDANQEANPINPRDATEKGRLPVIDKVEAVRFLNLLDPGATYFSSQTFDDDKGRKDERLARVIHGTLDDCWNELTALNDRGAGIFVTVNATDGRGRTAKNVVRVRALFVDLDGAPLDPITQDQRTPHIIIESSPEKFHVYWLVDKVGLGQFEGCQKALAKKFGGDPSVHDLPRVMRVPGFVHRKAEPFATRIVQVTKRAPYTLADFADIIRSQSIHEL